MNPHRCNSMNKSLPSLRAVAKAILTLCATILLAGIADGLLECRLYGQQAHAVFVNTGPGETVALTHALQARGLALSTQSPDDGSFAAAVVVLESKGDLSPQTLHGLESFVRHGGSLLIGLDRHPGAAAGQLAFLSPTMAWSTQAEWESRPLSFDSLATGTFDPEMFGDVKQPGFVTPYHFPIRPLSAAERGMARYDRYEIGIKAGVFAHEPGAHLWTRPLINRDWKVRLQGVDRAASPLLITGRYGAGRVAVFASGLTGNDAGLEAFWKPVVAWLSESRPDLSNEPQAGVISLRPDAVTADVAAGVLHVSLQNSGPKPLAVQLIGRILTWEEALVGDSILPVNVPANGTASFDLKMPSPGPRQYQALDWRRAFVVRLGVLSESGATLLCERSVPVDFTPAVALELSTDNLYQVTYPFPTAPGIAGMRGIAPRMGSPVMQYAYRPGGRVHATAVISNGVHNIAAAAQIIDETDPQNPSVVALNDGGAQSEKGPRDAFRAYGAWVGKAGVENVLRFHFPYVVTVTAVTLVGAPAQTVRKIAQHNPGAVAIECNAKTVLRDNGLDARFDSSAGLVRLPIKPQETTDLVIRMPWVATAVPSGKREAPWLGEVEIEGSERALPPEVSGEATLVLRDAMSSQETPVAKKLISVPSGGRVEWSENVELPSGNERFYQLQLRFLGETRRQPVLAIDPDRTLESVAHVFPPNTPQVDFLVTKGYRALFPLGTGTRDTPPGWETPDDLIWSYSRQVNQVNATPRNWPEWFYATDTKMAHYSNGWGLFLNGENIFLTGTPQLLERFRLQTNWPASRKAIFGMGDRWDSGPALSEMYGWQELVAFDEYLGRNGRSRLNGTTRAELSLDVNRNHATDWSAWHEQRYVETVDSLSKRFAEFGKELVISGQGIPMTSNNDAAIIGRTVKGMSSDNTWGMEHENIAYTTGRQLGVQAYNPEWNLGFNMVWGWDSAILGNLSWYAPVGTTEPSRRHYYDLAWRGIVNAQGEYMSSFADGFGMNGGDAWTMSTNDYQQFWDATERFSLLYPKHPLGAGLIVSSSVVDSLQSPYFNGGGMGGVSNADRLVAQYANAFQRLCENGLDISFAGNILGLENFHDHAPLILQDLSTVTSKELDVLKALTAHGARIAAFAGHSPLPPAVAAFFGVTPDGLPVEAKVVNTIENHPLLVKESLMYIPLPTDTLTADLSLQLAPILQRWLDLPIAFPEGTMGYGFISGRHSMIVVEDWKEEAREISLRIRGTGDTARAVSLNGHNTLPVKRDGADWLVQLPIRPGDGEVVILEQN